MNKHRPELRNHHHEGGITPLFKEYQELLRLAGLSSTGGVGDLRGTSISTGPFEIRPDDILLVVDMQNDFMPKHVAPEGGRFGVEDAENTIPVIKKLIVKFAEKGCFIFATKDYHPIDHVSFNTQGGVFPPHCVQGSAGASFFPPIREHLQAARRKQIEMFGESKVSVVFKGYCPDIDSFGAFRYTDSVARGRLCCKTQKHVGCSLTWTGAYVLQISNIAENIDSPPDVLSILSKRDLADVVCGRASHSNEPCGVAMNEKVAHTHDAINDRGQRRRLFICGLAFDYCVLDTALNARAYGFTEVYIVYDAARAAYSPGVGKYGSGFFQDPKEIVKKLQDAGVKCLLSTQLFTDK
eukprot:TRINITY_DN19770_c0_g1::TRINITY_DN19770_c0_g1_i1::g.11356::m.11356 TRINITY_DN19770_c0_g1::TRINITY_DN19770_c0_g1_i1::g.11356  ORF type:complete len:353 (+),score=25.58,sp/P21369/PNCA_ECOLI/32.39/3e-12,Isochorismatase/PF00857.15/3.8e-12,Isochorismatase/PF00857.15/5.6e-05 TRINITY_DN19770_c0_g1_i1:48-1106(+)